MVDATVSTPALVSNLFQNLPAGRHELVLFDINREAEIEPILKWNPTMVVEALQANPDPVYTLSCDTRESAESKHPYVESRVLEFLGLDGP